ncbi:MAG TPA: hypothetical protein VL171_04325 [Verrucomicrobiae bacterium]|nr:hypothetical protein [Verrucomicrobiae bacterium]
MKKNIWVVVLVIAVAALAVVVTKQHRQMAQMKEQLVSATTEKPKASPVPAPVVEVKEPVSEAKPAEPAASPAPPETATNTSAGTSSNYFAGLAKMMKNPQMKEMVRAQQKVMLDRQYGSLSKYLNLPAERMDALKELLANRQMALVDSGMTMMTGSDSEKKQALEDSKAIKADYDKQIQDLLGPQDYPVFQDYEKTLNERMSVQMFKDALPASDALTDQQEDNLIAAMYQERQAMPSSSLMNNQNQDPSQFSEEHIAELEKQLQELQKKYTDRAAGILTPSQLEQFTKWQEQFSNMQLAGLKMTAAMFGNKSPSQTPPATQNTTP